MNGVVNLFLTGGGAVGEGAPGGRAGGCNQWRSCAAVPAAGVGVWLPMPMPHVPAWLRLLQLQLQLPQHSLKVFNVSHFHLLSNHLP